jgi:hypothetical protein
MDPCLARTACGDETPERFRVRHARYPHICQGDYGHDAPHRCFYCGIAWTLTVNFYEDAPDAHIAIRQEVARHAQEEP